MLRVYVYAHKEEFMEAMKKECEAHYKEENYKLIKKDKLPEGATLLSSVWQMKRKRKPSTGEISKYKARMNVDGSQMIKGLHYEETYAPVERTTLRGDLCTSSSMGNYQVFHLNGNTWQLAYQTVGFCLSIHTS